jgi:hypothetical protein
MKNYWVIPTDKPSRLHLIEDVLMFTNKYKTSVCDSEVNIYITSNEEIKMDDWYLDDTNSVRQAITECESYWTHRKKYQKIILTTDPSLDGVQPIDNEFLEWFVKNPSCEFVEVYHQLHKDEPLYKIIIPQEEPKQELPQLGTKELNDLASAYFRGELNDLASAYFGGKPKQETLEDSIYQAIGLAANEQGIINQALATSKVMDVLKKTNL